MVETLLCRDHGTEDRWKWPRPYFAGDYGPKDSRDLALQASWFKRQLKMVKNLLCRGSWSKRWSRPRFAGDHSPKDMWGWDHDGVERVSKFGKKKVRLKPSSCREGLKMRKKSEVETMTMSRGSQNVKKVRLRPWSRREGLKMRKEWDWDHDRVERVSKWETSEIKTMTVPRGSQNGKKVRLRPWPCREDLKMRKKVKLRPWPC